jgi:hypothetical protein
MLTVEVKKALGIEVNGFCTQAIRSGYLRNSLYAFDILAVIDCESWAAKTLASNFQ